jgi:hypothetical protein
MSLAKMFLGASELESLDIEKPYLIRQAERVSTRFGPTGLISTCDSEFALKKVFLPRRYTEVVTDEDIDRFNSNKSKLYLIYRGLCAQTNGFLLAITGEADIAAEWG